MEAGRLGQILINAGALSAAQLEMGLLEQRRVGGKLGEILVRLNLVTDAQVTEAIAVQLNLATVRLDPVPSIPAAVVERIPAVLARAYLVLPLDYREEERTLVIATTEALKGNRLEELRAAARCWIVPRLASRAELTAAISRVYGPAVVTQNGTRRTLAAASIRAAVEHQSSEAPVRPSVEHKPRLTPTSGPAQTHGLALRAKISHPEVRALVKLMLDKGLVSPAEVHATFREPPARAVSEVSRSIPTRAEVD